MTFDEYQSLARTTMYGDLDPLMAKTILAMGISGEAGEVLDKWKKIVVYQQGETSDEDIAQLAKEMGDVLWYIAVLAHELGLSLDDIAAENLTKLKSRKKRGVIAGQGDNR